MYLIRHLGIEPRATDDFIYGSQSCYHYTNAVVECIQPDNINKLNM